MIGILRHLLVATDGSENGAKAVAFAIALASRYRSELLFCNVIDYGRAFAECSNVNGSMGLIEPLARELEDSAAGILADASKAAASAGVVATSTVLNGSPAPAIVKCAVENTVDAIVIGSSGKRGIERLFLGSVAEGVLRRTDVPAFVVPLGADGATFGFDRLLVAIDDSEPSDAAATFALALAEASRTRLVFNAVAETTELFDKANVYGYDPTPILHELQAAAATLVATEAERAVAANVGYESVVSEGAPIEKLLETAEAYETDLIVIGTHGRRGLRRMFLGSVAENIVRRSRVPVAVVRVHPLGQPRAANVPAAFAMAATGMA